jgi:hypothetical protein
MMKLRLGIPLLFCAFGFSLVGCGSSGHAGPAVLAVSGTVQAPNGQIVFYPQQGPLERFSSLFLSVADASVAGISPVADGTPVTLARINDAGIVTAVLATTTTSAGQYSFDLLALGLSVSSDLIVQVANPGTGAQIRAFVTSETVDLDPVSEAVVRLILDQIAVGAPSGPTLSDFTPQELFDLKGSIDVLTTLDQTAAGADLEATVAAISNLIAGNSEIMTFLAAASKAGQTAGGPGDLGEFFPFIQGNGWIFQGTSSTNGGTPTSFTHTETITGTTVITGVPVTVFTSVNDNFGGTTESYAVKDSRGITSWGESGSLIPPELIPYQTLRFPLEPNSTFESLNQRRVSFTDLDGDGKNEHGSVFSTVTVVGFEDVTVPAGSFAHCVKIVTESEITLRFSFTGALVTSTSMETQWAAPGIGPIKYVTILETQSGGQSTNQSITEELTSLTFGVGTQPFSVASGDFNGDGLSDLVTVNNLSDDVSILLGRKTGLFSPPTNFAAGNSPVDVVVGDFNGDGKLDLAVVNTCCSTASVLLGDGTGAFGPPSSYDVGNNPDSIASGDFDGDGNLDLAVGNFGDYTISILLGDGTGAFNANQQISSSGIFNLGVGDFNNDGNLDLAVPDACCGRVAIFEGDGTGAFGPATYITDPGFPSSLAIGDFNGDGNLDLAAGQYVENSIFPLLGDGTGAFSPAQQLATGDGPVFSIAGDINGDGKQDIITANQKDDTVSLLLGDGTGAFSPAQQLATGDGPASVAIGDFNGDGKLDLAVANVYSNNVSIIMGSN